MPDIKYVDTREEDILDGLILAKQFHKEAKSGGYGTGFDNAKVTTLINDFVLSDVHKVFFIEIAGEKVGFFAGCLHEPMFSTEIFATEIFLWIDKEHRGSKAARGAIQHFEEWALGYGAVQFNISDLQGLKSLEKLYNRVGYTLSEITYRKEV